MMEFMKKQSVGFYLCIIAIITSIIGLVRYMQNCQTAYFSNLGTDTSIVACFAVAIILEIVYIVGYEMIGRKMIFDICPVASAVLFSVGTILFVSARVNGIAAIMTFTNNASTMADLNHTIISFVFCVITMLLIMISSFMDVVKE